MQTRRAKYEYCWENMIIVGKIWILLGKYENCWENMNIVGIFLRNFELTSIKQKNVRKPEIYSQKYT